MDKVFSNKKTIYSFSVSFAVFLTLFASGYSRVQAETIGNSRNGGGNGGYDLNYLSEQAKNLRETFNKDYSLSSDFQSPLKLKNPTAFSSGKTISASKQNKQESSNGKTSFFSLVPLYKSALSSIADIPRQTAGVFSSIFSPVGDFVSSFFISENVPEVADPPFVKKTSSSRSSASSSFVIPAPRPSEASSEGGNAGIHAVPNSSPSATYPPATTAVGQVGRGNLKTDITRKEVEALIQQSDNRNLALIRSIITAPNPLSNSDSLSVQQSIDNLSRRISVIQENNVRQLDHTYNSNQSLS